MIRPVEHEDMHMLRQIRNKWQPLGIFRQNYIIKPSEQEKWFDQEKNPGFIINERAYGKIYKDNEIAFYGFDEWKHEDLLFFMNKMNKEMYYGECYLNNPFLTWWLDAGFKVRGNLKNRKCYNGRMYDSLLLEWHRHG